MKFYPLIWKNLIKAMDYILMILVIALFINHLWLTFMHIFELLYDNQDLHDSVFQMVKDGESSTSRNTNITIIHEDGTWSDTIRSLFIYGTGVLRYSFVRQGTGASKLWVIGSTIAADSIANMSKNAINDPEYIEKQSNVLQNLLNNTNYVKDHVGKWQAAWDKAAESADVDITKDSETIENITKINDQFSNNILGKISELEQFSKDISWELWSTVKSYLEPVSVDYSNELLARQINDISILLLILAILIVILIISFIFNIVIFIYSEKLINYFNNKYLKLYISLTKKFIAIELFCLGSSILYFMFNLCEGLKWIATHPIIF